MKSSGLNGEAAQADDFEGEEKATGAEKQMPQVTHWFPGSRRPSSPTCSRSGSASLSTNSPLSGSVEVYNRGVPILPLDLLGQYV